MYGVGADVVGRVLDCGGLGQYANSALGCVIFRAGVVGGDDAELGGYVDDGAAASLSHFGNGCLRSKEDALSVDVHDALPVLDGRVFDRASGASDAGVVDENVQRAEAGHGLCDCALPVGFAGYIEVNEEAVAAALVDFGFHAASFFVEDVSDCDLRALASEQAGFLCAHASRAATYECYFAVESAHFGAS